MPAGESFLSFFVLEADSGLTLLFPRSKEAVGLSGREACTTYERFRRVLKTTFCCEFCSQLFSLVPLILGVGITSTR